MLTTLNFINQSFLPLATAKKEHVRFPDNRASVVDLNLINDVILQDTQLSLEKNFWGFFTELEKLHHNTIFAS